MRRAPQSDDERAKWAQQLGCEALKANRGWCCKAHLADETFPSDTRSASSTGSVAPAQGGLEIENEESAEYAIIDMRLLKKTFQEQVFVYYLEVFLLPCRVCDIYSDRDMHVEVGVSRWDGVPYVAISSDRGAFKRALVMKNASGEQHLATAMSCAFAATTVQIEPTLDFLRECRIMAPSKTTIYARRNKVRKHFEEGDMRETFQYTISAVAAVAAKEKQEHLATLTEPVHLAIDGQFDSPGKCASFCTVTAMNTETG